MIYILKFMGFLICHMHEFWIKTSLELHLNLDLCYIDLKGYPDIFYIYLPNTKWTQVLCFIVIMPMDSVHGNVCNLICNMEAEAINIYNTISRPCTNLYITCLWYQSLVQYFPEVKIAFDRREPTQSKDKENPFGVAGNGK